MNFFCEKCKRTDHENSDKHIGYIRTDNLSYTLCGDCWPIFSDKLDRIYEQLAKEFIQPLLTGDKGQDYDRIRKLSYNK